MNWIYIPAALLLILLSWSVPFYKRKKQILSVIELSKIGRPPAGSRQKADWVSVEKLAKFIIWAQKHRFTFITASEFAASKGYRSKLPKRPILLTFTGGFQSVYEKAWPILKEKRVKSTVFLPVTLLGGYNAWQNPEKESWQNLLTAGQIKEMNASGLVEFGSNALDFADLNQLPAEEASWQAAESKARLQTLYKLDVCCLAYPLNGPADETLQKAVLEAGYKFTVGTQRGVNKLPRKLNVPLRCIKLTNCMPLWRLYFKFTRG